MWDNGFIGLVQWVINAAMQLSGRSPPLTYSHFLYKHRL
jgi:hypothetical protein